MIWLIDLLWSEMQYNTFMYSILMFENSFATYCVQHLNELWEVVKPACCCHLEEMVKNILVLVKYRSYSTCSLQNSSQMLQGIPVCKMSGLPAQPVASRSNRPGHSERSILFPIRTSQTKEQGKVQLLTSNWGFRKGFKINQCPFKNFIFTFNILFRLTKLMSDCHTIKAKLYEGNVL